MRAKRNNLLCMLIILLVSISGMYFEDIKVDSVFACTPAETSNTYISEMDSVITDAQACTTEMLGICKNVVTGQFTILFINIFSLNEENSYSSLEEVQLFFGSRDKLVANYIHKSDGKKRI